MRNYEVTTIYFLNDKGQYEANTVLQASDETIIVASIFKPDLKGIARTYIECTLEPASDDQLEASLDREEELEEMFEDFQNKGLGKIRALMKEKLGVDVDFDSERQTCREAIRKGWESEVKVESEAE